MKRMYAGRPGIMLTTTPLGFSSGGRTQLVSVALLFSLLPLEGIKRKPEAAGILDTQNDVLNEPGFVFSLVLQHAEVISGDGRLGWLGCETNR